MGSLLTPCNSKHAAAPGRWVRGIKICTFDGAYICVCKYSLLLLVLLYIHHLSLGYWKHKNLEALKTQRMISHPGKYIFSGMILCREQFVPSENKILALPAGEEGTGGRAGGVVPPSPWARTGPKVVDAQWSRAKGRGLRGQSS